MINRFVAIFSFLVVGVAAPASSALAFTSHAPAARVAPPSPYDDLTTGSVEVYTAPTPRTGWCVPSSASEGNANQ